MKKEASTSKTTRNNLETKFDAGESVLDYFDTSPKRVNVAFPNWTSGVWTRKPRVLASPVRRSSKSGLPSVWIRLPCNPVALARGGVVGFTRRRTGSRQSRPSPRSSASPGANTALPSPQLGNEGVFTVA